MTDSPHLLPRRTVVTAAAGLVAVAVPACATYDSATPPPAPAAPPPSPPAGGSAPAGAPAEALAAVSDVPVGGGTVLADKQLVITQPAAGTFAAFDATCTHQGCTVNEVANGTINCPCHGSRYRIADGSVANGPASRPLARRTVAVSGGSIVEA